MSKKYIPKSCEEVFDVMKQYNKEKEFNIPEVTLRYLAEDAFLFWESRNWEKVTYWPAVIKRWVLTSRTKSNPIVKPIPFQSPCKGESVRDRLLRERDSYEV